MAGEYSRVNQKRNWRNIEICRADLAIQTNASYEFIVIFDRYTYLRSCRGTPLFCTQGTYFIIRHVRHSHFRSLLKHYWRTNLFRYLYKAARAFVVLSRADPRGWNREQKKCLTGMAFHREIKRVAMRERKWIREKTRVCQGTRIRIKKVVKSGGEREKGSRACAREKERDLARTVARV